MTFETLDTAEQIDRLDTLAQHALRAWEMNGASLELAAYTNNVTYQVDDGDGRYILRVHRPGLKRRAWIESERAWLAALSEGGLRVPRPALDVVEVEMEGADGPVYCDLLGWLSGEPLALSSLSTKQIEAIGSFAARLHAFRFDAPEGFKRPRLDWEGLFGERSPYNPGQGDRFFTDMQREVIGEVTELVREAMEALGEGDEAFGLIHADLLPKNVLFAEAGSEKALAVVDFDDCAWGFYLYDLAPMLWVSRSDERSDEVLEAMWNGYTAICPLEPHHRNYLERFLLARHVASCRWVAGNEGNPAIRGRAAEIIAVRVDEMRHYLETGSLAGVAK